MTMHPDTWPPRRAGLHRLDDGDLPPIAHPERPAASIAAAPRSRSAVWRTLARDFAANAALGFATMMVALVVGIIATLAVMVAIDVVGWVTGGPR
ncbi:hypothetical protein [Elioraea sp.]|uniref:hypothetical protein n=1 Tax=Elioraea sp. TaxID=2185103 RepID=UPI0025C067BA|nr:hypothetical protein [Elioraea sp.]